MAGEQTPETLVTLALLTVECSLEREGREETSDAALLNGL